MKQDGEWSIFICKGYDFKTFDYLLQVNIQAKQIERYKLHQNVQPASINIIRL